MKAMSQVFNWPAYVWTVDCSRIIINLK